MLRFIDQFGKSLVRVSPWNGLVDFQPLAWTLSIVCVCLVGLPQAQPLLTESFDTPEGVQINIVPVGQVAMDEIVIDGGFLTVPLLQTGDGFSLELPSEVAQQGRCFILDTVINPDEFDHGEGYAIAMNFEEIATGDVFPAVVVSFLRDSFWNKCRIDVQFKNKDGKLQQGSVLFG